MRTFVVRLLRGVYESLVAFGQLWTLQPPPAPSSPHASVDTPAPPPLAGPPPGHPERLSPDLPLTPVEEAVARALRDGVG
ncbi:DUF6059 family protein [Streptomyces sp. NPDC046831]|uniref:DUF6059 family protein n=1 Tax=Streptomyces sp. NPDC046831 TaxID=3154805 RepID=UPI0033E64505